MNINADPSSKQLGISGYGFHTMLAPDLLAWQWTQHMESERTINRVRRACRPHINQTDGRSRGRSFPCLGLGAAGMWEQLGTVVSTGTWAGSPAEASRFSQTQVRRRIARCIDQGADQQEEGAQEAENSSRGSNMGQASSSVSRILQLRACPGGRTCTAWC